MRKCQLPPLSVKKGLRNLCQGVQHMGTVHFLEAGKTHLGGTGNLHFRVRAAFQKAFI